jgi:alkylation response protein AidB-like acyl-CoA dehydrogenase
MPHYKSNLRDLEFNLFEVFGVGERLGSGPYHDMDVDTAREILREVERLSSGPLAEPFADADRHPPVYDPATKTVTMPEGFKKSYDALMDSEWWRLDLPEHLGGTGAPPSLRWAASEMMLGSNPAAFMFMSGPGFASILDHLGNADQKRWAELIIEKRWGATMVLTEPDAGSDVGAGRAKAFDNGDGTWRIEASSASSPPVSTTWSTTSSIWSSPVPRAPAQAPRACRCSSCRSTSSSSRPANCSAATACTPRMSRRRWA